MDLRQDAIYLLNSVSHYICKTTKFYAENPKERINFFIALGTLLTPIATFYEVKTNLEESRKESLIFKDPTTNVCWELKRIPTNEENKQIANTILHNGDLAAKLEELDLLK